jgi:hypothetical protein
VAPQDLEKKPQVREGPRAEHSHRDHAEHSHHHDHHQEGTPELKAIFKHLSFRASAERGNDRVVCLQKVLMEELGIAKPDLTQLRSVVEVVCLTDPGFITEEEIPSVCAALPDAAARLAANGSPLAALLKDVPLHLAVARAVEQVLQIKPYESEPWFPGSHDPLKPRSMGHWRGELEVAMTLTLARAS